MKKLYLPLAVLCVAAFAQWAHADTVIEEIIARVNNQVITRTEFQRTMEAMKNEPPDRAEPEAPLAEREKNALRDLIDQQLLLEKGKDLGITGDTELVKKLDEIRKQMNLESMEDLEKAAAAQGVSYEDFKQNLRNNIITQQVIAREVGQNIKISEEETKKFYEEHKEQFERPEQVRISEILIPVAKTPSDAANAAELEQEALVNAEAKAKQVLDSIQKGAKFDEVAKKESAGPTAAQGGDLGYFKRGTLAKELENLTFGMKPGQVSDVIRTKQGFVILNVTEHQNAGMAPFKDVEPRIQDALYYQKLQPALRAYLTKLREEAYIDIKPGYADTGASPNQTKPVMMAEGSSDKPKEARKKKKKLLLF
jgi:peptidyl-prolyl cis-trans isomerase SurA